MNDEPPRTPYDPGREPTTWPTMREAGDLLSLTPNAIRQRIRRGSLTALKVDGIWRVDVAALVADQGTAGPQPGPKPPPYDQGAVPSTPDTHTTGAAADHPGPAGQDELIAQLRSDVEHLRHELEVRTREIERRDVIIMNLSDSLKALPASFETQQAESPAKPENGAPEAVQRAWWRRWFGQGQ